MPHYGDISKLIQTYNISNKNEITRVTKDINEKRNTFQNLKYKMTNLKSLIQKLYKPIQNKSSLKLLFALFTHNPASF